MLEVDDASSLRPVGCPLGQPLSDRIELKDARQQVTTKEDNMHSATSESLRHNSRPALPLLESVSQTLPGKIFLVIGATALIAAGAHISLRLPFTPVPLTMSDFAVLLVGMALGPTTAFSVVILYLVEGAAGMPVFNPGGLGGVAQLFGPTGGYLAAYPFAAVVAGAASRLSRSGMSSFTAAVMSGTAATAVILAGGATWLAHSHYLSASAAWNVAIAPFLFGAAAKVVAASMIFGSTRRWLRS
jgi:biotin transport system substrate-specific component